MAVCLWHASLGEQLPDFGAHFYGVAYNTTELILPHKCMLLKTLDMDTIGNCQRPVFPLIPVYLNIYMHKITNMWKFELNRLLKLRENNERNNPCHTKLCAIRWLIFKPQILNLKSRNQVRGKLLLSWKPRHFWGSRFSQCFLLSTSLTRYQVGFDDN